MGELERVGPVRVCLTERLGPVGRCRYSVLFTSIAGGFRLRMYRCDLMRRARRSLIWLGDMDECLPAYIRHVKRYLDWEAGHEGGQPVSECVGKEDNANCLSWIAVSEYLRCVV